ncbi:MAG: COX15/CtaA family protein [Akkermansiaceae bacterium]|jgi:heme a synthase|nr:COX15/CtaA family protein [Akkermansiaceae bacterium]MDP4645934.1 COX15/CtaA family protein [Akkermansiaceae bacterium]MDP4722408.1 COX15/CtaA family protein [Akkermansiaceae bacterium]MDP4781143.1 COX15/CtaA family protein [Akkermansiaceae bacterium]MDP4848131.1 COX15/CtaA family protein [Akkermansiaceae bacterium]
MSHALYQKCAVAALVSVLVLIFVGAIVRVTGAGMGCPDWPTCWGLLIPPTKVEEVDFDKLPIEKFQKKAERMGRDPSTISRESLRKEFNPRHVWTEFVNRLFSLPVGFFAFATFIISSTFFKSRPHVFWLSFASLLLVLANAIMGARVVYSGISPGVLSSHLALAMLLICVLVHCVWAGGVKPWKIEMTKGSDKLRIMVAVLLGSIVVEGILGSQIREITDEMAKAHLDAPRETWIAELEQNAIYLIHRSFSWLILILAVWAYYLAKINQPSGTTPTQKGVVAIVFAQMILGVVMAQVHIYSWVQVLHVGLAAILLALAYRWLLIIPKKNARLHLQPDVIS